MTTVTGETRNAFALIEVIGVLAILVILTFLLLPRISKRIDHAARVDDAVHDARVADTLIAIQAIKTAAQAHYAQFGTPLHILRKDVSDFPRQVGARPWSRLPTDSSWPKARPRRSRSRKAPMHAGRVAHRSSRECAPRVCRQRPCSR